MSGVRYTAAVAAKARSLHEGGWKPAEIRRILAEEGVSPVPTFKALRRWIDDDYRERDNRQTRRWESERAPMTMRWPGTPRSVEWRIRRVRVLDGVGLSASAIAKVMSHDFPDTPLTESQVRGLLHDGSMPRSFRKAAAA